MTVAASVAFSRRLDFRIARFGFLEIFTNRDAIVERDTPRGLH